MSTFYTQNEKESQMRKLSLLLICLLLVVGYAFAEVPTRDYTVVTKTATTTTAVTDSQLWNPAGTDSRIVLQAVIISSTGIVDVDVEVSNVDVIPPVHMESRGTYVNQLGGRPIYVGAKDVNIDWTTSSPDKPHPDVSIMLIGYEELVG